MTFRIPLNVATYCAERDTSLVAILGEGKDGSVYETDAGSAVKLHHAREVYERERDAYFRLLKRNVRFVRDLAIPKLLQHDDEFLILELTIVAPPFLLDFASAYLDEPPDWPEDVVEHWHEQLRERFEDRYGDVVGILAELEEQAGVHLFDVHADNLKFDPS
ncbi:MAG: hypothetical protein AAGI46_00325 [Planctomycetota bacterium]